MTTLSPIQNRTSYQGSDVGNSSEYKEVESKRLEAIDHYRKKPSVATTFSYLFSSSSVSQFEDRVEQIRDSLMDGKPILSRRDVVLLKRYISHIPLPQLLALMRLLGPLLESSQYSEDAAEMLVELLHSEHSEVRYTALEAISYALGEVLIADGLLDRAKEILQEEKSVFVSEYLNSL